MDHPESKTCSRCKEHKPLNLFYTLKPRSNGPRKHSWCIVCVKAEYQRRKQAQSEWAKTPERRAIGRQNSRNARYANPAAVMLKAAKSRAKKKKIPFNIDASDVIIPSHCPIFGIPIIPKTGKGRGSVRGDSPALDRIETHKGYVKGNVMVISFRANAMKSNGSIDEIRRILLYMQTHALSLLPTTSLDSACL